MREPYPPDPRDRGRGQVDATAPEVDALDAAVEDLRPLAPELRVLGRYGIGG